MPRRLRWEERAAKELAKADRAARQERRRRVHGWAFRRHSDEEVAAIQFFLATGEEPETFPAQYRQKVEKTLDNADATRYVDAAVRSTDRNTK